MKTLACLLLLLLGLSAIPAARAADALACDENYQQTGSFFDGRTFTTWAQIDVAPKDAFKRAYRALVKAGLLVVNANADVGVLSLEQSVSVVDPLGNSTPGKIVWSVAIDSSGKGSKITVTKTTPAKYSTSRAFQIKSLCSVVSSAAKP